MFKIQIEEDGICLDLLKKGWLFQKSWFVEDIDA
jgi:hypothetical protein